MTTPTEPHKIPTARTEPQLLGICGCGSTAEQMPISGGDILFYSRKKYLYY